MTLPPVVRVFFAIALPDTVKEALTHYMAVLKKQSKTSMIRWSHPDNLHITLQFLPEVQSQDLDKMMASVRAALHSNPLPLTFTLGRLQIFPDPYRPRVIVMDINPQAALASLSSDIGQGIVKSGYAIEDRPYRAHMTLARIKQPKGLNLGFLAEVEAPVLSPLTVHEVVLFRSEPQPEGSRYTPLDRIS